MTTLTVWSRNNMGVEQWSDGYINSPSYPEMVVLTRCPHCSIIFWVADAKKDGSVAEPELVEREVMVKRKWWFGSRTKKRIEERVSALAALPAIKEAGEREYISVLAWIKPEDETWKEKHLRLGLWWFFNHRFRTDPNAQVDEQEDRRNVENIQRLITHFDPKSDQGRLKIAPILMALGRFGDARAILSQMEEERLFRFRDRIMEAADQSQRRVFRLR